MWWLSNNRGVNWEWNNASRWATISWHSCFYSVPQHIRAQEVEITSAYQILKLKHGCVGRKRAPGTTLGHCMSTHHPRRVLEKKTLHHLCRVLVCVQCLQFNSQRDSLFEGYLPGRVGPKKNQCSIFLGLYLFFTGWVVINTQACGKKRDRPRHGAAWGFSPPSSSTLSARGLKENWETCATFLSAILHSLSSW